MSVVIATYTTQIVLDGAYHPITEPQVVAALVEAEENLTDLLPDGYSAVIRRWDEPDTTTQEGSEP